MFGLSATEVVIIIILALVLLGPDRLPEAARMVRNGLRDLRRTSDGLKETLERETEGLRAELQSQRADLGAQLEENVLGLGDQLDAGARNLLARVEGHLPVEELRALPSLLDSPATALASDNARAAEALAGAAEVPTRDQPSASSNSRAPSK
jgi:Tat protein translocase TatB subunit